MVMNCCIKKFPLLHNRIFSFLSSFVRTLNFSQFFLYFFNSHSFFLFVRCLLHMLPAAPTAALAALERLSVATIGPSVAAAGGLPRAGPPPPPPGAGGWGGWWEVW